MPSQLSPERVRQSITAHAASKGEEIHLRFPRLGWAELNQLLGDPNHTRYPCEVVFGSVGLFPGEFAHADPKGDRPEDGFRILVHPFFQSRLDQVPILVLYHLVTVNYGEFVSAEDAEVFGAAAMGLDREDYYAAVCRLADELDAAGNPALGGGAQRLGAGAATPADPPSRAGTDSAASIPMQDKKCADFDKI